MLLMLHFDWAKVSEWNEIYNVNENTVKRIKIESTTNKFEMQNTWEKEFKLQNEWKKNEKYQRKEDEKWKWHENTEKRIQN